MILLELIGPTLIFKRKVMIAIIALVTMIMVIAYYLLVRPVYESTLKLLIESPKGKDIPFTDNSGQVVPLNRAEFIKTQIQIIKSYSLVEKVVKKLQLHKRKITPNLKDRITILFRKVKNLPLHHTVDVLRNKKISIEQTRGTDIVMIKVRDIDPLVAANIANTLAQVYMDYSINIKGKEARSAYGFISQQIETTAPILKKLENELENFKQKGNILSIDVEAKEKISTLAQLEREYLATKKERTELLAKYQDIIKKLSQQPVEKILATDIKKDPIVQELKSKIMELESQLSSLLLTYDKNHPKIIEITASIEKLKEDLKKNLEEKISETTVTTDPIYDQLNTDKVVIETQLSSLEAKEATLLKNISTIQSQVNELSKKDLILNRYLREINTYKNFYTVLLEKQQEALSSEIIKLGNIRIVEYAIPAAKPKNYPLPIALLISLFGSLMVSIILCFSLEYFDTSFKTSIEVEEYFQIDVLGTIPRS
ncbi:MAG: GumC family protein [bacterium]